MDSPKKRPKEEPVEKEPGMPERDTEPPKKRPKEEPVEKEPVETKPVKNELNEVYGRSPILPTLPYVKLDTMNPDGQLEIAAYLGLKVPIDKSQILNSITHYLDKGIRVFETFYNQQIVAYNKRLTLNLTKLKCKQVEYEKRTGMRVRITGLNGLTSPDHEELFGREFRDMTVEQQIIVFISKRSFGTMPGAMSFYGHLKRYVRALFVSRRIRWQKPANNVTEGLPTTAPKKAQIVGFGLRLITLK